ncbi:MAG: cohesin domain-containing protein, partial [Candidatus Moraniibacteriota bacterium]
MLNSNLEKNVEKGYQSLGRSMLLVGKRKIRFSLALLIIMFFGGALTMLIWNASSTFQEETVIGSLSFLPKVDLNKTQAAANSTLLFNPASVSIGGDQQFTLDARINPGTNAVSAVELHVTYDQTKFRLDSITASSTFSLELAAASINNTNGTASIALAVPLANPSVTTASSIATFSFHSLASVTNSSIAFATTSIAAADGEPGNAIVTRTPATVTVDGTAPTITSITSSHANGTFTTGEIIPVSLTFAEAVTSTGNVTVTVETGTTDRTCTFTVTNSTTGSCNYTV